MDISAEVKRIITKYKTNDPFVIAEYCDITVRYENLGMILGYTDTRRRCTQIHLNINTPEYLVKFVCLHELGHVFLHKHLNIPCFTKLTMFSKVKFEKQANLFAILAALNGDKIIPGQPLHEFAMVHGIPKEMEDYYAQQR